MRSLSLNIILHVQCHIVKLIDNGEFLHIVSNPINCQIGLTHEIVKFILKRAYD